MVLESIITPREAENKPIDMLILGAVASSFAILLAYYISCANTGRVICSGTGIYMILFIAIAVGPLIVRLFQKEEEEEETDENFFRKSLWGRHDEVIKIWLYLFFGILIALSFWFTVLPEDHVKAIFKEQIGTRDAIAQMAMQGRITHTGWLGLIMQNNLRVLSLSFILAFIFGSGAILVLAWNASVIAVVIGNLSRGLISSYVGLGHFASIAAYFHALPISISSLVLHGLPEMLAYFIAGIAGGIFSSAVVRHHYRSPKFFKVLEDVGQLLLIGVILIIIAAFIEVGITPLVTS